MDWGKKNQPTKTQPNKTKEMYRKDKKISKGKVLKQSCTSAHPPASGKKTVLSLAVLNFGAFPLLVSGTPGIFYSWPLKKRCECVKFSNFMNFKIHKIKIIKIHIQPMHICTGRAIQVSTQSITECWRWEGASRDHLLQF